MLQHFTNSVFELIIIETENVPNDQYILSDKESPMEEMLNLRETNTRIKVKLRKNIQNFVRHH